MRTERSAVTMHGPVTEADEEWAIFRDGERLHESASVVNGDVIELRAVKS